MLSCIGTGANTPFQILIQTCIMRCKKQPVWSVCLYSIGRALPGKSCVAYSTPSAFQDILEQLFGLASPFPHLGTGGAIGWEEIVQEPSFHVFLQYVLKLY